MGRAAVACRGVAGSRLQPADRWAVGVSQATEGRIEVGSANQAQAAASAILTRRGQGQGDGSPWAGLMGGRVGEAGGVRVEIRRSPRPSAGVRVVLGSFQYYQPAYSFSISNYIYQVTRNCYWQTKSNAN
jgi:hypothetical protein